MNSTECGFHSCLNWLRNRRKSYTRTFGRRVVILNQDLLDTKTLSANYSTATCEPIENPGTAAASVQNLTILRKSVRWRTHTNWLQFCWCLIAKKKPFNTFTISAKLLKSWGSDWNLWERELPFAAPPRGSSFSSPPLTESRPRVGLI
jgi:hypothetical protein